MDPKHRALCSWPWLSLPMYSMRVSEHLLYPAYWAVGLGVGGVECKTDGPLEVYNLVRVGYHAHKIK